MSERDKKFEELENNPEASVSDWETLAGEYIEAGEYLRASMCFARADVIKDANMPKTYGQSNRRLLEIVGASWDSVTVA